MDIADPQIAPNIYTDRPAGVAAFFCSHNIVVISYTITSLALLHFLMFPAVMSYQ